MSKRKGPYTDQITYVCKLLDRVYGENWHDDVDINKLDMSSYDNCLLGQLFDGYRRGVQILLNKPFISYNDAEKWGYDHAVCADDYTLLNQLWYRRIRSRREKERNNAQTY